MSETPFQRALDRVEDVIFRMTASQRACLVRGTLRHMRRNLPEDHPTITAFLANHEGYRHRALANIAKVHQGWPMWLPLLLVWNSCRSGIDIFEYAVSWWLVQRRWVPNRAIGWLLATLALICIDVRRAKAEPQPIPAYCLAALRAPVQAAQIGFLQAGWQWFPAWMLRPRSHLPDPEPAINHRALMNGIMRAGLAAVIVLSLLHGHAEGVSVAALGSAGAWEVRPTGAPTRSGFFNQAGFAPGTDYTQQDAAHVVIDGASITATVHTTTTQLNIVGYTVADTDNRNSIRIAGGSMTPGTYEITAVDVPNNRWTIDRSGGTAGQTGTGEMGGGNSDPALVAALLVAGQFVHQQSGTYPITSASTNVAGGCVSQGVRVTWEGYQITRGDLGTRPVLQASGISTATLFAYGSASASVLRNVTLDGAGLSSIRGLNSGSGSRVVLDRVHLKDCTNNGLIDTAAPTLMRLSATGCSSATAVIASGGSAFASEFFANTITGAQLLGASFCLARSNTGASSDGLVSGGASTFFVNSTLYGNGRDGIRIGHNTGSFVSDITEADGGYGVNIASGNTGIVLLNHASYNNTSGATNGTFAVKAGDITGSESFFTNAAGGDFSLNTLAGGGALARAAGIPGVFPGGTVSYLDRGAAQHADPTVARWHQGMRGGLNG